MPWLRGVFNALLRRSSASAVFSPPIVSGDDDELRNPLVGQGWASREGNR